MKGKKRKTKRKDKKTKRIQKLNLLPMMNPVTAAETVGGPVP